METLIVEAKDQKELATIKAVLKALKVSFRTKDGMSYNPDFVAKINKARKQVEEGEYITIDPEKTLWENIL